MKLQVIDFIPPVEGVEQEFNTFRLGWTLVEKLSEGQEILLMDKKAMVIFGRAQVLRVEKGTLRDMCEQHAHANHRELANPHEGAADRLMAYIVKLFGPHIATETKRTCVVYLRRIE